MDTEMHGRWHSARQQPLRLLLFSLAFLSILRPLVANAHHEAIFGHQSSLVFSAPGYLSTQLFSRNIGAPNDKVQEKTGLISGGYSPFTGIPLSFMAIQPTPTSRISIRARHKRDLKTSSWARGTVTISPVSSNVLIVKTTS